MLTLYFNKPIAAGSISSNSVVLRHYGVRKFGNTTTSHPGGTAINLTMADSGADSGGTTSTDYTAGASPFAGTTGVPVVNFTAWPTIIQS